MRMSAIALHQRKAEPAENITPITYMSDIKTRLSGHPPRVLYHFRTQGKGAEAVHIAGIAGALEACGYAVTFSSPVAVNPKDAAGTSPFSQERLGRLARLLPKLVFEFLELGYNAVAFVRNRRILRAGGFSFIYERHAFFLFSTAWLARRFGLPLVVEVNELAGDDRVRAQPFLSRLVRRIDRTVFQQAALIVVVSPHLQRRVVDLGIPASKVLVLPNAVRREDIVHCADGTEFRRRLGLGDAVVIAFIGWFVPWHRLDRLIEVFARLRQRHPSLRLLLVGEGPLETELRAAAARAGVSDDVLFPGSLPHARIPEAIAASDIAVVPHSNAYRSPIKLFEYMAQARTVVAPATEPITAVITPGYNGLLFDPESAAELETCLERAIQNPAQRLQWGEAARSTVLEHHTWEANTAAFLRRLPGAKTDPATN